MRAAILTCVLVLVASAGAREGNDPLAQAKEHFRRGTQLYDLGHFLEAASEYQEAFRLSDRAAFLFNIAQAYRLGGKPREALAAYEGYLRRAPDSPQRGEVEEHIAALEKQIHREDERAAAENAAARAAEERAASARTAPPAPSPLTVTTTPKREAPLYKRWWVWTTVGVVAVGVAVGVGIGLTEGRKSEGSFGVVHY